MREPSADTIHKSDDNALVFTLPEALMEIRALREQKAVMLDALRYIAGSVGGAVGERAARALLKIEAFGFWQIRQITKTEKRK